MYLVIDNSYSGQIFFYLFNHSESDWSARVAYQTEFRRSLLYYLDNFLREQNLARERLKGLLVVVGKGSFTATRIAVTIANVLAFGWELSVAGVTEVNLKSVAEAIQGLAVGVYVSAKYSGHVHIGGS